MPPEIATARHPARTVTKEDLQELGRFCDENAHALSFYFSVASTPDNSHHEELIAIKRLIQEKQSYIGSEPSPRSLAKDLEELVNVAEEIRVNPARLRVVFACDGKHLWREFDLPAPNSISQIEIGRRFRLYPLFAALQRSAPYCVVLLETGKARPFIIRGTEIVELEGRLPIEDLSLHAGDSRVGWSKRIDKNVAEHEKAYFKKLAHSLLGLMAEQRIASLLIGCRDDLWSEVRRQFSILDNGLLTHFRLPNFTIDPTEVLRSASLVFEAHQRERCRELLNEINETPSRATFGVGDTLRDLEQGRVQRLVLAQLPHHTISECQDCGRMWAEAGQNCIYCGSARFRYLPAEEGLIRYALNSDVETFLVEAEAIPGFSGVASLLRY